jgi:hypothetical protein
MAVCLKCGLPFGFSGFGSLLLLHPETPDCQDSDSYVEQREGGRIFRPGSDRWRILKGNASAVSSKPTSPQ